MYVLLFSVIYVVNGRMGLFVAKSISLWITIATIELSFATVAQFWMP